MPNEHRVQRILYVEGNVDETIGGSFFSLLFLVEGLDRERYKPTVVFSFEHRLIPRFEAAGARVIIRPLAKPVTWSGALGRLAARFANLILGFVLEPLRLAWLCRDLQIDLVHLNNSIVRNHPWIVAARLRGIPCVTHERGINREYSTRSRALGRKLDAVICISKAVRDNFEHCGVRGLRLVDIPNALDPNEMQPKVDARTIREEIRIPASARLVGIVGNLKHWKGQEVVIRAMQRVAASFPDVVCLLIGDFSKDDSAYREHILRLIDELGVRECVVVTGYRSNVADYVNALEILIHASIEPEPFGRVLLEGMALNKPLVASRGGAVPEIVVHGTTGLLFEPGDAGALASALMSLLHDPERAIAMGVAGRRRLAERFTIEVNCARTQQLYRELLEAR